MNYNPLLPEVIANPYPYYTYLRRHAPVSQVDPHGWWVISRYDDIMFALKNYQLFSNANFFPVMTAGAFNPLADASVIVMVDPPVHTRLRKLANRAFTPRIIAALEPRIHEIARDILAEMTVKGTFDLMRDFAIPLPGQVIAELIGVEPERREDFRRWSDIFMAAMGGKVLDAYEQQDLAAFRTYFEYIIERCRREPQRDLISALVQAEEEGQQLTAGEVFNLAIVLLLAGNETTTNLIGNTALALLRHPQELAKVQGDPALVLNLVEEGLRYDSPVHSEFRLATQDVPLGGVTI
ncbi:MAG: cytochrome P450, partial [Candidatus Binatia bacterium]